MSKVRFTAGRIAKLECDENIDQMFIWDLDMPGLGARVTKTGSKAFIFQSRVGSKPLRMTIGNVKIWTIDAAQKEARRLQTMCDTGIDPRLEKKNILLENDVQRAQEVGQQLLVRIAWFDYIKAHEATWGNYHLSDHIKAANEGGVPHKYNSNKKTLAGPVSKLLDMRLVDITAEFLESWVKKENETRKTQAALSFRLFRSFMNWCEDQPQYSDLVNLGAHKSRKVRKAVYQPPPKSDSLQREQLEAWFREVIGLNNSIASAYLQTIVLTGARRESDASLLWTDIDFEWKSIRVWDKVRKSYRQLPLTPYVESLLKNLPRRNEYVFSSLRSATGYIAEPRTALNMTLERAKLPHVNIHDLRRTFSNMCEWVEVPSGLKRQIMGHRPKGTNEKHYTDRPLDLLRMRQIKIEKWILNEARVRFSPYDSSDVADS